MALLLAVAATGQPQTPTGESIRLELQSTKGTSGCAVVWNPKTQMYYSIIAGNTDYPIDVFDKTGKWLSQTPSGVDSRGMWCDAKSGKLGGRAFDGSIVEWSMADGGKPGTAKVVGKMNVDGQYVGTFGKGYIYLYRDGAIEKYSIKGKKSGTIKIPDDLSLEDFNTYSIGFTGVKGYEFVLYNVAKTSLVFLDMKGKMKATVKLPDYVPYAQSFRFSFANNHAWLYDADTRAWSGFKIF